MAPAAWSQANYWDINGSTTGSGGPTPTGNWNTTVATWNTASGTGTAFVWGNTGLETAVFAAGTDATGSYTVTLNAGGAINLAALQINLGSVILAAATSSDVLNFGSVNGSIFTASGSTLTLGAVVNGSGGITKSGAGTLTLAATNTYTGTTTVSAGGLTLDFSQSTAPVTNIINSASALALAGGSTLTLVGKAAATNSQAFNGLAVSSGADVIALNQNTATSLTAALGNITQSAGGTLNFSAVPLASGIVATTTNSVVNGILGPWATVGTGTSTQYATISGGNIVAYSGATAATANLANATSASTNYSYSAAATVAGARTANTLQYTGAATTTALAANTLTLNGLLQTGTGTLTFSRTTGGLQIGATNELVILGPGSVTINAPIGNNGSNASSLTYSGNGTLTLGTVVSTYTGTTTVNSGTVTLALANVLNSASSVVVNGGVLGLSTFAQSVNAVSLKGGSITGTTGALTSAGTFNLDAGSVSAILAGSVGLNKNSAGTLALSGANTFSGTTAVNAGVINYQNATAFATNSAITVASGGTVQVQGGIAGGSQALSLAGVGAAGATGALESVSGNNSYAGLITLSAAATISSDTAANALTLSNTGTITGSGFNLTLAGAGNGSIGSSIGTGSGGLIKNGAGAWTLSGANSFTGATVVNGGGLTLDYTTQNNAKLSATSSLTLAGAQINLTPNASADTTQTVLSTTLNAGSSSITVNNNVGSNNDTLNLNTITRNTGSTLNIIYGITGTGIASATTNNTNTNSILGGWATLNGQDWAVNSTNGASGAITALGSYTSDTLAAGNNTDITIAGANPANGAVSTNSLRFNQLGAKTLALGTGAKTISSGGILITPNVGAFTTTISGSNLSAASGSDLIFQQYNTSGSLNVSAVIQTAAAGGVVKAGPGVLVLSGANTFTGSVSINQGILSVGTVAASGTNSNLGAGSVINLGDGSNLGTLLYTGATTSTNRNITLGTGGGAVSVSTAANVLTLSGVLSGGGNFSKIGDGSLTLAGSNTITGSTAILDGTLTLDYTTNNNDKVYAGGTLTLGGGALSLTANGAANSTQTVLSTLFSAGANTITLTKNAAANNATLNLNSLTNTGGATVNFVTAGTGTGVASITTNTLNTNGIIGGWATINGTDWAVNSTNAAGGAISALTSYYTTATGGTTAANYANQNVDVTTSVAPAAVITPYTLRFNTASANTLTLTGTTNTIGTSGILVTANVGANLSTMTGGTLRGPVNGDLVVNQFNPSGALTIGSVIGNNTSTRVVKTGAGTLNLTAANTFSGGLVVNQGTVAVSNTLSNTATNGITVNNGGTLSFGVSNVFGNYAATPLAPVTINAGGTLTNSGAFVSVLGALNLNGGTLTTTGGNATLGSWGLKGTVTVNGGAVTSTISATGTNGAVELGQALVTGVTFNVADGSAATDLLISAVLKNGTSDGATAQPSSLTKTGAGTLALSGANTFSGGLTVNQGTVVVSNTLSNTATNTITVNSGGVFNAGASNLFGAFTATPLAPLVINAGATVTNNGAFYSVLGPITLNGGTLNSAGGFNASYLSWGLKDVVTVNGGAVTSTISSTGANSGIALGSTTVTGTTFNVADGAAATDLLISAVIGDGLNSAGTTTQASSFTKSGAGLALLTAVNTYTGNTNITAGTLALSTTGTIASSSVIQVSPGALLDVSAKSGGLTLGATQTLIAGRTTGFATDVLGSVVNSGTLSPAGDGTAATLTISSGLTLQDGGKIRFDFGTDGTVGGGVNDLIVVNGTLSASGVTTIVAPSTVPVSGVTYTLITAGATSGLSVANFAFGSSGTRQTYAFDTTTTPGSVLLTATGSAANLTWTGAVNGTWDVSTTTNWSGAADQTFFNLDNATFDDSSAVGNVTLATNVQPLSLTVNNSLAGTAYSITGSGVGIIGTSGLLKQGSGTLTLSATNSFTGTVEIQQGTVSVDSVSNAGSASSLGAGGSVILGAAATSGTLKFTPATSGSTNKNVLVQAGGGAVEVTDPAGVLTVSGLISGSGALAKTGSGTLVLANGASSYSGVITVSSGTLRAGTASVLGTAAGGTVIQSGATLDVNGFNLGTEAVSIAGTGVGGLGVLINGRATTQNSALRFATLTGDSTLGGTGAWGLTGTGTANTSTLDLAGYTLTKTGTNTITLTSTLVTNGNIIVNQGTLGISLGASIAGTGTITINSGGTFTTAQNGLANTLTRAITLAGGTLANAQNSSVASAITLQAGTSSIISNGIAGSSYNVTGPISGAGDLAINITATATGATTTNFSGAFSGTGNVTITNSSATAVTNFSGGVSGASNLSITNSSTGTTSFTTTTGNSITGTLSSSGATFNIVGTGTVGTFTAGGGLTLGGTGGVVRFDLSSSATSGNDQLVINGPLSLSGSTTINVNAISSSLLTAPGSYTLISGGTSLAAGSAANLTLAGIPANVRQTFALDTTTVPGSVLLDVTGSVGNLTWAGPGTWDTNTSQVWNGGTDKFYTWDAVTFDDSSANGAVSLTSTVSTSHITVNNNTTAYTISGASGVIAGFGGLLKQGSGVLTIATANTYTGGTTISAGEVRAQTASALGNGTTTLGDAATGSSNAALYLDTNRVIIAAAVVVSSNGSGLATLGSRSTVTGSGATVGFSNVTLQRDVVLDSNAADQTDYHGISGTGNITIQGTGRTVFNGTNTFTGNITVAATGAAYFQDGITTAGSQNYIPDTSSVTVNSGARFALSVGAESIDALNGAGTVNVNGINSTLTVGANGGSGNFSGTLANNTNTLALVKTGAGTQILSGANTYNAGTTVSGGTLLAENTTGSGTGTGTVTVSSGATLGGNGFIAPAAGNSITINGTLNVGVPGESSGQALSLALTGAGNLALNGTTLLNLFTNTGTGTLNGTGATDLLQVSAPTWSNVTLGGSSTLTVATSLNASTFIAGDSWRLFDWSGILGGTAPVEGTNGFSAINLPILGAGYSWDVSQLFTTGVITVSGVPEPGRAVLLLLGLLGLISRRRRRTF